MKVWILLLLSAEEQRKEEEKEGSSDAGRQGVYNHTPVENLFNVNRVIQYARIHNSWNLFLLYSLVQNTLFINNFISRISQEKDLHEERPGQHQHWNVTMEDWAVLHLHSCSVHQLKIDCLHQQKWYRRAICLNIYMSPSYLKPPAHTATGSHILSYH